MVLRCNHCQAELKEEFISAGGSVRCERCGSWADANFLGHLRRNVGIHPALAKRYGDRGLGETQTQTTRPKSSGAELKAALKKLEKSEGDSAVDEPVPSIPGYELLERIGKGAMGSVYRANHLASGREAAVKVLSSELSSRHDLVARFEREAAALGAFRHPNVVAIIDSGTSKGIHYYCMEYIIGATLRRHLKNGPLQLEQALYFMRVILRGLKAAHDRGIIHRDLKPENVLVEKSNEPVATTKERVVLVDFGLAGIVNEAADPHPNLTRSRVTMGTVNYMAPEQHIDAKRVDFRTDLYACGVILYECITGDLPLGRFQLPTERGMRVPKSVDTCLAKALARSLDERYQNATQFDEALAQIEQELKVRPILPFETPQASAPEPVEEQSSVGHVYYMPNARSQVPTSYPTQWMTTPPWIKKPTLAWGVLALVVGLVVGIVVSKRTPKEVVVSSERASPIYSGSSFKAPGLSFKEGANKNFDAKWASNSAVKLEKWKSESPVWNYENQTIAYLAKQGDAGHFRRDMAFVLSSSSMPKGKTNFEAKMTLERVKLPLDAARAQHLARELLGGTPELAAGGVFYATKNLSRAVGMVVFVDGSCGLAELQEQNGFLRFVQYVRGVCKQPVIGKSLDLGIQCDPASGQCSGFAEGHRISMARIDDMDSDSWKPALGCRNINCLFDAGKRK